MDTTRENSVLTYTEDPYLSRFIDKSMDNGRKTFVTPTVRQCITVISVWWTVFVGCGLDGNLSSVPYHKYIRDSFALRKYSWLDAVPTLSVIPGFILAGLLMSTFGRRNLLIFAAFPLTLRWPFISLHDLLSAFIEHHNVKLAMDILGAICSGFIWTISPIFIGEISNPKHRGLFLASLPLAATLGAFFKGLIDVFFVPSFIAKIFSILPAFGAFLLMFSSESPLWLLSKGRRIPGLKVYGQLRGYHISAIKELKSLLDRDSLKTSQHNICTDFSALFQLKFWKPTLVVVVFNLLLTLCEMIFMNSKIMIIIYYYHHHQYSIHQYWHALFVWKVLGFLQSILLIAGCLLFHKLSRRSLCMWSSMTIFVSVSIISLVSFAATSSHLSWYTCITLASCISYICFFNSILVPLSTVLYGELLPLKSRGFSSAICNCLATTSSFVAMDVVLSYGVDSYHIFLGVCMFGSLLLAIIMSCVLQETFRKTLADVERYYEESFDEN